MTEQEAKTKWCPMRLVTRGKAIANNVMRPGDTVVVDTISSDRCITSGCMMWRTHHADGAHVFAGDGYCGLAGKS